MTEAQEQWARCRPWLKDAVEKCGLYSIEDIEREIEAGQMQFWPGKHCAAVTEFITYPKGKVLNVFAGGGVKGKALKELREMEKSFVIWAKASECKWIFGYGRHEAWKPICTNMGYRHMWTVMTKGV